MPDGLRPFASSDLHLTVAFLGSVSEASARAAFRGMSFDIGSRSVTLGAVVPMGPPNRYSALSAVLVGGRDDVEAYMGRVRVAAYEAAGATPDKRPPKAHVTLARPKRKASEKERAAALTWAAGIDLRGARVELDSIALYTWSEARNETLFRIVDRASSEIALPGPGDPRG